MRRKQPSSWAFPIALVTAALTLACDREDGSETQQHVETPPLHEDQDPMGEREQRGPELEAQGPAGDVQPGAREQPQELEGLGGTPLMPGAGQLLEHPPRERPSNDPTADPRAPAGVVAPSNAGQHGVTPQGTQDPAQPPGAEAQGTQPQGTARQQSQQGTTQPQGTAQQQGQQGTAQPQGTAQQQGQQGAQQPVFDPEQADAEGTDFEQPVDDNEID